MCNSKHGNIHHHNLEQECKKQASSWSLKFVFKATFFNIYNPDQQHVSNNIIFLEDSGTLLYSPFQGVQHFFERSVRLLSKHWAKNLIWGAQQYVTMESFENTALIESVGAKLPSKRSDTFGCKHAKYMKSITYH